MGRMKIRRGFELGIVIIVLTQPYLSMTIQELSYFQYWLTQIDETDKNQYVNITYDCLAFSQGLVENATIAGFQDIFLANIQDNRYPEGHWITALLVDEDFRFFEPQADKEIYFTDAEIIILNPDLLMQKQIKGKNNITITGDLLIPVKMQVHV